MRRGGRRGETRAAGYSSQSSEAPSIRAASLRAAHLRGEVVVKDFGEAICLDRARAPTLEFAQDLFLLKLIERLARFDPCLDQSGRLLHHAGELLQVVDCRKRPVAGDDFRACWNLRDDLVEVGDQTSDASPAAQIDERESPGEKIIAHVK